MAAATYMYCCDSERAQTRSGASAGGASRCGRAGLAELAERLWLVLADVPLDRYGPGPLEESLRDLQWVSSTAVAHEAVVEHLPRCAA